MTVSVANDKRRLLASHPLFGALGSNEIDRLTPYVRTARFRAGSTIFRKGDPGSGLMQVVSGRVKITSPSPDGKEVILNVIDPGEIFGEIALLDGQDRTADAIAMADCEILVLNRRDFLPFLREHPDVCIRLLELLCTRLRHTSAQVEDVLFFEQPARLARTLLRLARRHSEHTPEGVRLKIELSQREIGDISGLSRESVNRQLRAWHRDGIISLSDTIIIRKWQWLERIADGLSSDS